MMGQDDRAIVVGVKVYPELGDLGGPENDATAFYDWLLDAKGGNVPKDNVRLIVSSGYQQPFSAVDEAEPTTLRVQRAFEEIQTIAKQNSLKGNDLRAGRRLYLYMAGHGFAPRDDQAALLMANATRERAGYHILGQYNGDWFYKAGYFDEIVLLMDCCREVYPVPQLNMPYGEVTAPDAVERVKRFYGFGTKWSRLSRERDTGKGIIHGVFTTALLAGLQGAASDPATGQITAGSLSDYLYNSMKDFLRPEDLEDADVPKEPDIFFEPKHRSTFVLATVQSKGVVETLKKAIFGTMPVAPKYSVEIHITTQFMGQQIQILSDRPEPVESTVASSPTWQVSLERGMYLIQVVGESSRKFIEVTGAGGVTNVDL